MSNRRQELVEKYARTLGEPRAAADGAIPTEARIVKLSHADAKSIAASMQDDFDALCRKIHVAKRVTEYYGPGWGKLTEAPPLRIGALRLLVAGLLQLADDPDAERGLARKSLNAALAALDLMDESPEELDAWADEIVARAGAGADRS